MGSSEIRAALKTRILTATGVGPVLAYPPKQIEHSKTVYIFRSGFEATRAGQVRAIRWMFTARLCIQWVDEAQAEADLDALSVAVVAAIDADPHLGGVITSGLAEVTGGDDGWFAINGQGREIWFRYCDVDIAVLEK